MAKAVECYRKSLHLNPLLWSSFERLCQLGKFFVGLFFMPHTIVQMQLVFGFVRSSVRPASLCEFTFSKPAGPIVFIFGSSLIGSHLESFFQTYYFEFTSQNIKHLGYIHFNIYCISVSCTILCTLLSFFIDKRMVRHMSNLTHNVISLLKERTASVVYWFTSQP